MRLIALVFLAACLKDPVATTPTDNPKVPVETMFTHDGCTVYRFTDARSIYWVKCVGATSAAVMPQESCGKNCVRTTNVPTVEILPTEPLGEEAAE